MIIETKKLSKQFNGKGGFKNISLSVREGEIFSFLGKNGAGKSTFIRTLLGILHADSGEGYMLERPIGSIEARKKIGYLPEMFQYYNWLTGYELLYNHGLLYKMTPKEIKSRMETVIDLVGLRGHEHKKVKAYSKGMRQRIGLGCAIMPDPELLFLDEPTSALDPIGRKDVRDIILELKAQGKTIFLNTHLLSEAEIVSDCIAIIDNGEIKKTGTVKELLHSTVLVKALGLNDVINAKFKSIDPNLKIEEDIIEMSIEDDELIPDIAASVTENGGRLYMIKRKENVLEQLFIDTVDEGDDEE